MNYQNLKIIMSYVRSKVKCHYCKKLYKDKALNIVETTENSCLIVGFCTECRQPALIEAQITPEEEPVKNAQIQIRTRKHRPVTENEIMDIHNFLKDFNGDFKKLFIHSQ